nr:MAG TPA: hypothetical protein [Caudoviricetes sp.]
MPFALILRACVHWARRFWCVFPPQYRAAQG